MSLNRIGRAHPDHPDFNRPDDHADRPCCGRRRELDQLRADVRVLADDLDAAGHHDLADRLRTQTYIPGESV